MTPETAGNPDRRAQILAAATRVFARQGFDAASMNEIIAEAGISKGGVYWYFKSKDEIIGTIVHDFFQRDLDNVLPLLEAPMPAPQKLETLIQFAVQDIQGMMDLMPLAFEAYALAFHNPQVKQALEDYLDSYMAFLVPLIQRGVERGEFRPVDATEAALAISALIEGTLLLWVFKPRLVSLDRHIQSGIQLLLDGLRPPKND